MNIFTYFRASWSAVCLLFAKWELFYWYCILIEKIPHLDAVKISKDLKKHLVEANKLEIPQEEVNDILFEFMRIYNYGEQYINRYKMISK